MSRKDDLNRFYDLMADLRTSCGGPRTLATCSGRSEWPKRGVYFFFDAGEFRSDGVTPRVVRVGTHALRPSRSTLWGRLSQHRGQKGGANAGGGNHRASIFRYHVGTALLANGGWPDDLKRNWGVRSGVTRPIRDSEHSLERAVTCYIGALPFLWLEVDDQPTRLSDRGVIEAGAIGLLSNVSGELVDSPSPAWLGNAADRDDVRQSGLWNVDHVRNVYDPRFLDVLAKWIQKR